MVKLCKDCEYSIGSNSSYSYELRCINEEVNKKDPRALSSTKFNGSSCRDERSLKYFGACSISGKLFKAKG